MNDTSNSTLPSKNVPAENELGYPQAVLYIPSIAVATVLIVFLVISFVRYHFRVRNKMGYFRDYVEKNLHVKRERIPGHVNTVNNPRIGYETGSVYPIDQTNNLEVTKGHTLPDIEHGITIEDDKNIYLKKPRTPKSFFDNEGYEEDISSNRFSRTGYIPRPTHELEMQENYVENEADDENETSLSKSLEKVRVLETRSANNSGGVEIPVTYLCETCQNHLKSDKLRERLASNDKEDFLDADDKPKPPVEKDDDAFQRSPKPSTHKPPLFPQDEPKTRKTSINSRTFPDARLRLGVFELEPR